MAGGDQAAKSIEDKMLRKIARIHGLANDYALTMEAEMKANRPWMDRTGNARRALHCNVVHDEESKTLTIVASHGVEYGVFLEYANSGKFAILKPTTDKYRSMIIAAVRRIIG